jgi:hypothetical protein
VADKNIGISIFGIESATLPMLFPSTVDILCLGLDVICTFFTKKEGYKFIVPGFDGGCIIQAVLYGVLYHIIPSMIYTTRR